MSQQEHLTSRVADTFYTQKSGGWTIRFKTDLTSRFDAYHYEQISLAFQKVLKLPEPIPVKVLREAREAAIAFNGVAAVMTTKPMQKYLRSINHLLHINPYTTDDPVMVTISNWKLLNPRWNDKWFENGW